MSEEFEDFIDDEQAKLIGKGKSDEKRADGSWLVGVVFVALGVLFLLGNVFPGNYITNWWAVFILIPALFTLRRAWRSYREHGQLSSGGSSALLMGTFMLTLAVIFLLGLDCSVVWTIFLIVVGVGLLLPAFSR